MCAATRSAKRGGFQLVSEFSISQLATILPEHGRVAQATGSLLGQALGDLNAETHRSWLQGGPILGLRCMSAHCQLAASGLVSGGMRMLTNGLVPNCCSPAALS